MYRIAVLTSSRAQEAFLAEQISRFCAEHCLFPKMDCYHDQESFFEAARNEPLTNAVIALPGVDGLNAVEHLRALCPQTRIIWCSDLDFSLHAFRLRADYFLLEPVTDAGRQCCRFAARCPVRRGAALCCGDDLCGAAGKGSEPQASRGKPLHGQERCKHSSRWLQHRLDG